MGSARKHDRARGKDKESKAPAHPTPVVAKVCGCPVPDPIRCFLGEPLPPGADGVKMECSNEKCPFADVLLHQKCFEAFEDHLIKVLSNLGSARGWTEAQRRANLWDKKGQSLIAKVCRCRCGFGLTRMDEIAAYDRLKRKNREEAEAQREAALAAGLPTPPTKRKHRTKNALPKLNFGVVKVAPRQPHVEERETRSVTRRQGARLREQSTSSVGSSYLALESRRESFTYASDVWGLLPSLPDDTRPHSVMSGNFADHDDTISTSSKNDLTQESSNELIPAPLPPRQTMSYASAMKSRGPLQNEQTTSRHNTSSPLSIQIDVANDSGVELKSGSTTSSDYSELVSIKDIASPLKECMMAMPSLTSLPLSGAEDELLSVPFDSDSSISTERLGRLSSISDDEASVPQWHLFGGTSFELGESIVANLFLPLWSTIRSTDISAEL